MRLVHGFEVYVTCSLNVDDTRNLSTRGATEISSRISKILRPLAIQSELEYINTSTNRQKSTLNDSLSPEALNICNAYQCYDSEIFTPLEIQTEYRRNVHKSFLNLTSMYGVCVSSLSLRTLEYLQHYQC